MKIKSRFDRSVLYEGDHATIKLCVEAAVKKVSLAGADLYRADLAGANLTRAALYRADLYRADLAGACLTEANLSGADLAGAYLSRADLAGADLAGAYLSRADLSGANLTEACLSGADLTGADLAGADLIDGGQDARGYRFLAQTRDGIARIMAGCHDFTVAEARAHWGRDSRSSNAAECLGKVEMIAAEAQRRGWPIESGKAKVSA